ncbi:hypothetical protein VU11_06545 [Desulfobulbus sp. US2]|nr:hypothetical protein [Desulfobulbus sp. US2]
MLEAVPGTMAVGELLGMALVWCDTAGGCRLYILIREKNSLPRAPQANRRIPARRTT